MTPEEWHQEVNGTLQAIVLACTSMIATHPEKQKVLALLNSLSAHAAASPKDSPDIEHYKIGMRAGVSTIAKGVETAQLATEIRDLKFSSGSH